MIKMIKLFGLFRSEFAIPGLTGIERVESKLKTCFIEANNVYCLLFAIYKLSLLVLAKSNLTKIKNELVDKIKNGDINFYHLKSLNYLLHSYFSFYDDHLKFLTSLESSNRVNNNYSQIASVMSYCNVTSNSVSVTFTFRSMSVNTQGIVYVHFHFLSENVNSLIDYKAFKEFKVNRINFMFLSENNKTFEIRYTPTVIPYVSIYSFEGLKMKRIKGKEISVKILNSTELKRFKSLEELFTVLCE